MTQKSYSHFENKNADFDFKSYLFQWIKWPISVKFLLQTLSLFVLLNETRCIIRNDDVITKIKKWLKVNLLFDI